ncbi:MAG TPA: Uma2 family endonuclease [Candidatus Tectomicrobia bacterium]
MTAIVLKDGALEVELSSEDPEETLLTTGVSWQQYESLLVKLGDSSRYRVTYLEGVLEIMSPSRHHEVRKKNISRLLEVYFEETQTRFWGLGSTTFRRQVRQGGAELDECYCLGEEKDFPDLAIEVVITSGGVDKLEVYRRLGVREVWLWHNEQFSIHHLCGQRYDSMPRSELLPNLNMALLAEHVIIADPLQALLQYRQRIRQDVQQKKEDLA